jgi:CRISPR-associated endonuclease/helicase Cas3
MNFYAHSIESKEKDDWQTMLDHARNVGDLAYEFAQIFSAGKAARLAGLLHDVGKYNPLFQKRLEGAKELVDHSTAGAALVRAMAKGDDAKIADLLSYAIAGHHAGLPDRLRLCDRVREWNASDLEPTWKNEIMCEAGDLLPPFQYDRKNRQRCAFQLGFLGRMLFSCLVDADYKDTEEFYCQAENRIVDRDWPSLKTLLPDFIAKLDEKIQDIKSTDPINQKRKAILDYVLKKVPQSPGLFTLNVPTGGGKTFTSLAFALRHAQHHGMRRIIYSIPFTSIIDQTAALFKEILGEDYILEYHSAIEDKEKPSSDKMQRKEGKDKLKLAMEDWAALSSPIFLCHSFLISL